MDKLSCKQIAVTTDAFDYEVKIVGVVQHNSFSHSLTKLTRIPYYCPSNHKGQPS